MIEKLFGEKADLMEAIQIVDDFNVEAHDLVHGVANGLELPDKEEVIKI